MSARAEALSDRLKSGFSDIPEIAESVRTEFDLVTIDVPPSRLIETALKLRDDPAFDFKQLSDLCGVDYATYGQDEWYTETEDTASYSRAVDANATGRLSFDFGMDLPTAERARFVVVMHLLSLEHNVRLRLRCPADDDAMPIVPSVSPVWNCANWYEREAFDLFGILFEGHDDLRRLLTDYGFVGHPFRKDFPLVGNVEVRYDPVRERVIYEPVSIQPRVLVPRVIRHDNRYIDGTEGQDAGAGESRKAS